jgi:hypothetical protein
LPDGSWRLQSGATSTCNGPAGWSCSYKAATYQPVESLRRARQRLQRPCRRGLGASPARASCTQSLQGTTPAILRADLDGKNEEVVAPLSGFAVTDIKIDAAAKKICFYDGKKMKRANLDGSSIEDIWTEGHAGVGGRSRNRPRLRGVRHSSFCTFTFGSTTSTPWVPASRARLPGIDLVNRQLYWSDYAAGYPKNILRVGLDGKNVTGIVRAANGAADAHGRPVRRKIWADGTGISGAGYDGHDIKQLLAMPSSYTNDSRRRRGAREEALLRRQHRGRSPSHEPRR